MTLALKKPLVPQKDDTEIHTIAFRRWPWQSVMPSIGLVSVNPIQKLKSALFTRTPQVMNVGFGILNKEDMCLQRKKPD